MLFSNLLSAFALQTLVSTALAGNAYINNHCGYQVTILSTYTNTETLVVAGGSWSEALNTNHSLKIAKDPSKIGAHGITQFEYSITDRLWYDISLVDCANFNADGSVDGSNCAGYDGGIHLEGSGGVCQAAALPPLTHDPTQAYFVWNDDKATKSCPQGDVTGDITMTLCAGAPTKRSIAGRILF